MAPRIGAKPAPSSLSRAIRVPNRKQWLMKARVPSTGSRIQR
jgi:hypothetical protein